MHRMIRVLPLCFVLLALPVLAQDKAKDKPKEPDKKTESKSESKEAPKEKAKEAPKTAPAAKKYTVLRSLSGKVTELNIKDMTVEVEFRVPAGRNSRNEKKTFTIVEDAKIRAMKLPDRFDEKDKLVPYTAQEKYKARGDNLKLPGYTAELSALKKGLIVEVEVSVPKPPPGTPKKKNAEPEELVATMIVIHGDEPKAMEKKKP